MKHLTLFSFIILLSSIAYSQDYMDDIATQSCECLNTISDTLATDRFNMELGLCMINAASEYQKELKKDHNINFSKIDTQGERLGTIIGLRMATICPEAVLAMAGNVEEEDNPIEENTYIGRVASIDENRFIVFSLRDEDGKLTKFYWLSFIESNLNFELTSQYRMLQNEVIEISYTPQEFFDFKIEEYRTFNIIQKIELISY